MKAEYEPATKEGEQRPVATKWRPTISRIVDDLVEGKYPTTVAGVRPVGAKVQTAIREYVEDYGETLAPLPEEAWPDSVCQWLGTHWEAFVDLWTEEAGRSDMVLSLRIFEEGEDFEVEVRGVHVP